MSSWWEEYTDKVPFSSHPIRGTCHPHDLLLLMLALITRLRDQVPCYIKRTKIRTTSDLNNILKHLCTAPKEWEVMGIGTPWKLEYLRKLFEVLLQGLFVHSHSLIYVIIHLYEHGSQICIL